MRPGAISVLVVDDDSVVRETLAAFCDTLGYVTRTVVSADEARRAVTEHTPDVILVDVGLAGGGLTLLRLLRDDDTDVGVVLLSGRTDISTALLGVRQGAVDFLEKPIDLEALELVVRRTAELVRLRKEVALLRARGPLSLADVEREAIGDALRATDGNKVRAARLLGIARSTLLEKLKRADTH